MRLIDDLYAEHVRIERTVGALLTFSSLRTRGDAPPGDGAAFLRFFRLFAGDFHHAKEEDTLFPALLRHLELRPDSGPIYSLTRQHREMGRTLGELAPLLPHPAFAPGDGERMTSLATAYAHALLAHIDAENSVLLPEGEERLRRAGVTDLAGRAATDEERAAGDEGDRLAVLYPPGPGGAVRGEGCVICPSYGVTCEGLEREWWTDHEWEAFESREG